MTDRRGLALARLHRFAAPTTSLLAASSVAEPIHVVLDVVPCDDESLTCVSCLLERCEHQFAWRGDGRTSIVGVHARCLRRMVAR